MLKLELLVSSVACLSDGKFVVTWESRDQDGSGSGIYGQMFSQDGSKYGSEFQINTYTTNAQSYPSVAGLSNGKFVVTWESRDQDGSGSGIYGQMFSVEEESSSSVSATSILDQVNAKDVNSNEHAAEVGSIRVIMRVIVGGASVVLCIAGSGAGYWLYRGNGRKGHEQVCDVMSKRSEEPSLKEAVPVKKNSQEEVHAAGVKSEEEIFGVKDIQRIKHEDLNFGGDLGEGSFGRIRKATWRGSRVAVKVLKKNMTESHEFMGDFLREAATWSKLTNPNITRFYGICWTKPLPCIVVEYVSGGSLASHLKNKDLTLVQRLGVGLDIIRGLIYLHEYDPPIWHRDIKPDNVLVECTLDQNNKKMLQGKVTDFGTARQKILNQIEMALTKEVGTPRYQAPEIIEGSDYSEKADIYSVGICLHEIYTQNEPYSDQPDLFKSRLTFFKGITKKGVSPTIPEEMPKSYAKLIKQCWAERSSKRPNAIGVEQQLKPIVDNVAQEALRIQNCS